MLDPLKGNMFGCFALLCGAMRCVVVRCGARGERYDPCEEGNRGKKGRWNREENRCSCLPLFFKGPRCPRPHTRASPF